MMVQLLVIVDWVCIDLHNKTVLFTHNSRKTRPTIHKYHAFRRILYAVVGHSRKIEDHTATNRFVTLFCC